MSDWLDSLTPDERSQWDEYVAHFRRDAMGKIAGAAVFTSIMPSDGVGDPKFWMELGAGIMFNKPIIVLAMPGAPVPDKLRLLADRIVFADIDTEEGREHAAREMADALHDLT
jgi:hypothetical protein